MAGRSPAWNACLPADGLRVVCRRRQLFRQTTNLGSGTVAAATNYGGGGLDLLIGNRGLLIEGSDNTFSDAFWVFGELSEARMAQYGASITTV